MRGIIFAINFFTKIKSSQNVRSFGVCKKKSAHFLKKIYFFKFVFNQETLQKISSWRMIILVNYNWLIWRGVFFGRFVYRFHRHHHHYQKKKMLWCLALFSLVFCFFFNLMLLYLFLLALFFWKAMAMPKRIRL